MDWFSWLSRSSLEPSLIYEYGLDFARNELEEEDLVHFNHEFLQSMGISIAKHRLEILKLAKKEVGSGSRNIFKLILVIKKTKKSLSKRINKWVFHDDSAIQNQEMLKSEPPRQLEHWRGALLRKHNSEKDLPEERLVQKHRRPALSGPIDGRVQERLMLTNRSLKLSGPLDGRPQERVMFTNRSPKLSGPLDGRLQERVMFTNRSPKLSGPLDGRLQESLMFTNRSSKLSGPIDRKVNRSPKLSGPLDGRVGSPKVHGHYKMEKMDADDDDYHSLWATLFQDMKPT